MFTLVFPAHGALGPLDEVLFLGVVVIFILMMAVSWMRSGQAEADEIESDNSAPTLPPTDENRFELK